MNIAILTKEYSPRVYGGAGVHVDHLCRELARQGRAEDRLRVFCFGDQAAEAGNLSVTGLTLPVRPPVSDPRTAPVIEAVGVCAGLAGAVGQADLIHCHTWYTHLAGCLLKQLLGAPLVLTTHSLEPHRPWKADQLGPGYRASTWLEGTAYANADGVIAVSASMKQDVQDLYGVPADRIEVIHNGIDTGVYRPRPDPAVLRKHGVDPDRPYALLVARLTGQKGVEYFIRSAPHLPPGTQAVVCTSHPDNDEIEALTARLVESVGRESANPVVWVREALPVGEVVALMSGAAVFVCPSIYEPFGIIVLEAMACGAPVVASKVGGIPEAVEDGVTGFLVPPNPIGPGDHRPTDPDGFARDLAAAAGRLLQDADLRAKMSSAGRERVGRVFTWAAAARRTRAYYQRLVEARAGR